MKKILWLTWCLIALNAAAGKLGEPVLFTGTCDASAALGLSGDLFVVANDEDNLLRFYRFSKPGPPLQTFDLKPLFTAKRKAPELDLEGVARLGDRVFFITSHGRNSTGKPAPARHQLFALALAETNGTVAVQPAGRSYINLVADLACDPKYTRFDLADAAGLAPKAPGGFNIEALAATPEGALLIGFRSPIPERQALVATLLNPNAVIQGKPAEFGEPLRLDLGGLGLRDICATTNGYYLLAGPADGDVESRLYFWAGGMAVPRVISDARFIKSNPEGICVLDFGDQSDFLIVSDDGARKINGQECKTLPEAQRQFRAYRYHP
jgi:hypothetical protein